MPIAIFKDWNMDNLRGLMYHKLVEEAFYLSFFSCGGVNLGSSMVLLTET
jgi:hypothetical protein